MFLFCACIPVKLGWLYIFNTAVRVFKEKLLCLFPDSPLLEKLQSQSRLPDVDGLPGVALPSPDTIKITNVYIVINLQIILVLLQRLANEHAIKSHSHRSRWCSVAEHTQPTLCVCCCHLYLHHQLLQSGFHEAPLILIIK